MRSKRLTLQELDLLVMTTTPAEDKLNAKEALFDVDSTSGYHLADKANLV